MNNEIELSEKQLEYTKKANHRWNGKIGATQCGKTYIDTLFIIISRIEERIGKNGLNFIVGVSKETIQRNVIEPMQEIFGAKVVTNISSNNTCTILGEKVYCLGADNVGRVSKFRGARAKYIYIDEVVDINREVFELLKTRLSFEYSICDFSGNPQSLTHWFKDFLESNADIYCQHYTIFDNPFLPKDYVNNLCLEYGSPTNVYYRRYILGQWCNAEGVIFTPIANDPNRYIKKKYIKDENDKEISNIIDGYVSIGIDWGGNGSKHSICATIISRDYSKIQVLESDLMISTGTNTKQVFKWINDFIQRIIDTYNKQPRAIFCDSAEQVLNNSLRSELNFNIPILDSVKTPIEERIKCLIRLMNSDRISFIEGGTKTIISALQTALYDEKSNTDRWIDDGKTSDIDSLDSFVYSWEKWMKQLMIKKEI